MAAVALFVLAWCRKALTRACPCPDAELSAADFARTTTADANDNPDPEP